MARLIYLQTHIENKAIFGKSVGMLPKIDFNFTQNFTHCYWARDNLNRCPMRRRRSLAAPRSPGFGSGRASGSTSFVVVEHDRLLTTFLAGLRFHTDGAVSAVTGETVGENLKDVPDMLDALAEVNLHAIQTSGNTIRNGRLLLRSSKSGSKANSAAASRPSEANAGFARVMSSSSHSRRPANTCRFNSICW